MCSVKDTSATAATLETVRDGVLRENLSASQLIWNMYHILKTYTALQAYSEERK